MATIDDDAMGGINGNIGPLASMGALTGGVMADPMDIDLDSIWLNGKLDYYSGEIDMAGLDL